MPTGESSKSLGLEKKAKPSRAVTTVEGKDCDAFGYEDGTVQLHEKGTGAVLSSFPPGENGHMGPILQICFLEGDRGDTIRSICSSRLIERNVSTGNVKRSGVAQRRRTPEEKKRAAPSDTAPSGAGTPPKKSKMADSRAKETKAGKQPLMAALKVKSVRKCIVAPPGKQPLTPAKKTKPEDEFDDESVPCCKLQTQQKACNCMYRQLVLAGEVPPEHGGEVDALLRWYNSLTEDDRNIVANNWKRPSILPFDIPFKQPTKEEAHAFPEEFAAYEKAKRILDSNLERPSERLTDFDVLLKMKRGEITYRENFEQEWVRKAKDPQTAISLFKRLLYVNFFPDTNNGEMGVVTGRRRIVLAACKAKIEFLEKIKSLKEKARSDREIVFVLNVAHRCLQLDITSKLVYEFITSPGCLDMHYTDYKRASKEKKRLLKKEELRKKE